MNNINTLELQNLGTIAGGFDFAKLDSEERSRYIELNNLFNQACREIGIGMITKEEFIRRRTDFNNFRELLAHKY